MQANRFLKRRMEWEGLSILHHWTFVCLGTQPLTHRWGMVWQKVQVKDRTQWEVQTVQLLLENESSVAEKLWDSLKVGMTIIVNLLDNPTEKELWEVTGSTETGLARCLFSLQIKFSQHFHECHPRLSLKCEPRSTWCFRYPYSSFMLSSLAIWTRWQQMFCSWKKVSFQKTMLAIMQSVVSLIVYKELQTAHSWGGW